MRMNKLTYEFIVIAFLLGVLGCLVFGISTPSANQIIGIDSTGKTWEYKDASDFSMTGDALFGVARSTPIDTTCYADTDGIVTVYMNASGAGSYYDINGRVNTENPPTTSIVSASAANGAGQYGGVTFPVGKGQYWKVVSIASNGTYTVTVYWTPIVR